MHGHPTLGVKNAKPRLSSKPGPRIGALSEEYLEIRNLLLRAMAFLAEWAAAVRRGVLIQKRLVTTQASYLLTAMRQKILNVPQTYSRRLVGLNDREIAQVLEGAAHSILNEIKDLPNTVTNPHWLASLEEKGRRA